MCQTAQKRLRSYNVPSLGTNYPKENTWGVSVFMWLKWAHGQNLMAAGRPAASHLQMTGLVDKIMSSRWTEQTVQDNPVKVVSITWQKMATLSHKLKKNISCLYRQSDLVQKAVLRSSSPLMESASIQIWSSGWKPIWHCAELRGCCKSKMVRLWSPH